MTMPKTKMLIMLPVFFVIYGLFSIALKETMGEIETRVK